ncbi:MAG: hypothetical protein LBM67_04610 [Lentimicrobiaceae bacterium]|jgi:hypothetical protein|nr:hypothetical protein [Lentimicrobiaceae bacterium]
MQIIVFSEKNYNLSCIAAGFLHSFEPKADVVVVALSQSNPHSLIDTLKKEACINYNELPLQMIETTDLKDVDMLITLNKTTENIEVFRNVPQQIHLQFDDSALEGNEFEALRKLRDVIKNEMYIIYRDRIRK